MSEEEWWNYRGDAMPFHDLETWESHRRLLLFGCACCRRVWDLLRIGAARKLIEVAEAFADGEATERELQTVSESDDFDCMEAQSVGEALFGTQFSARVVDAINAVRRLADPDIDIYTIARKTSDNPATDFVPYPGSGFGLNRIAGRDDVEWAIKLKLLRDIFGNPFRPVVFDPAWLTPTVVALTNGIYSERAFDRMPILADALEEAGCDNAEVLLHCRGDGPHVKGCWVVDAVLGKE